MNANDGYVKEAIEMLEKELLKEADNNTIAELILSLGSIQYNHGDYPRDSHGETLVM